MIMKIDELNTILKDTFNGSDPRRRTCGNMCFNCGRDNCKFLLTGEMFYGQEVGKNEIGNIVVYECPKFKFRTHEWVYGIEALKRIDDVIDYMRYLAECIDNLNKEANSDFKGLHGLKFFLILLYFCPFLTTFMPLCHFL